MAVRPSAQVSIQLNPGPSDDEALLEAAAIRLRRDLLEIDEILDVTPAPMGDAPPGSKGMDVLAAGTLVVTILATAPHLRTLVSATRAALGEDRSVTLQIGSDSLTVTGVDSNEQQRLINLWLERHQDSVQ
jgi:hypothetical protein